MSSFYIFDAANHGDLETVKMFIKEKGVSPAIVNTRDYLPETLVEVATKKGYLDMLKYLLEKHPTLINVQHGKYNYSREPCNLLQLAIEPGHLEIVKYLVENHGADIYEVFDEAYTAINWAIISDSLNIVKYFIEERNVDVNKPPVRENDQYFKNFRPLLYNAIVRNSRKVVNYLIKERKANLTVIVNRDENILCMLLNQTGLEIIRHIIFEEKNKIDMNWKENGYAFLKSLVRDSNLKYGEDILRYLVREKCKGWNDHFLVHGKTSLLHYAASHLSLETIACLIENGADIDQHDRDGNTALHLALFESFRRGLDICKYLCEKGANVNLENKKGRTPLDVAIKKLSEVDSMLEACKLFIEYGADLNSVDTRGNKLMHIAVERNLTNLLDYLVRDKHVDINTLRETDNSTPLHCAAFWNNYEICKYLIEHGALVHQKNKNNTTPFDMAMQRILKKDDDGGKKNVIMTRLCKLFLAQSTKVNWTDIEGNQLVHIAAMRNNIRLLDYLVLDKQVDINAVRETDHWTPLHCAAFQGNVDTCIYLIRQGALVHQKNKNNTTPFDLAVQRILKTDDDGGKNNVIMTRLCEIFLAHSTNVNWTDIEGNQLVHIAAMQNNIRLLDYLVLDKQVDVNAVRETDHWTPLHCAASQGNFDTCIYLIRQGADTLAKGKCGKTPAQVASDQELIDFIKDTSTTKRHRRSVKDYFAALLQIPTYQEYTQRRIAGEDNRNTIRFLDDDYIFGLQDFFSYTCLFSRYFFKNSINLSRPWKHTFVSSAEILQGRMDSIAENAINDFLNFTDA